MNTNNITTGYAARLEIDYPEKLDRLTLSSEYSGSFPPAFFVLFFLNIASFFASIMAWFAILVTGRYPRGPFNFNIGVCRWWLWVRAFAFLQVTDCYPPYSLASAKNCVMCFM